MITMQFNRLLVLFVFLVTVAVAPAAAQTVIQADGDVDTVILASTENYPDAMIAAPAAKRLGIPILLTEKGELPQETQQALDQFQPSELVLIGGTSVISADLESSLAAQYNVTRLWGTTRYGTAVDVAEYFWSSGSDEAILIQNSLSDREGFMLAAAKELARDEMVPIYLTPDDSVPAVVLNSLQTLGVTEVTVVGPSVSDSYRSALQEINVSVTDTVTGPDDDAIREKVQDRLDDDVNASSRLLVIASSGYRHSIAASNPAGHHMRQVTSEDDVAELVTFVNTKNISVVKVAGQPSLARSAAEQLRNGTDAKVELVVAEAAEAVRMNANLSESDIEEYRKHHQKRVQHLEQLRQERQEFLRKHVNRSIQRADERVDENASQEARDALKKARLLFSQGNYVEARQAAQEAISEVRETRFEERARDYEEVEEMIREETQTLQERVQALQEINSEFAQEMRENMTTEERLETIEEFRNERREKIRDVIAAAKNRSGDLSERLREARHELRTRVPEGSGTNVRFQTEIECADGAATRFRISGHDGYARSKGTLELNNPNYHPTQSVSVDRENQQVTVDISFQERDGFGIQCVAEAAVRHRVGLAAGNWTVDLTVTVAGEERVSQSRTVTVTPGGDDTETVDVDRAAAKCTRQIQAAMEFAAQQGACTMQVQELECPLEDDVTHQATDGCQISYLKEQGWTAVDEPETNDTTDTDDSTTSGHVVEYTADGFTPSSMTITAGESVTWVQADNAPDMWVASNQHPSHTEYDGTNLNEHCENETSTTFDQCESGDRYSFTFDKAGEWGYHNHLNSGHTGTVVVEPSGSGR